MAKRKIFLTPEQRDARDRIIEGLQDDYKITLEERAALIDYICDKADKEKAEKTN